jgi:hypothetical protein
MKRKKGLLVLLVFAGIISACTALTEEKIPAKVAVWAKTYGETNDDRTIALTQTSDGGYVIAGYTLSFGAGMSDFWVIKLDSSGAVVWEKTYGGTNNESVSTIVQASDGGYIVAGYSASFCSSSFDIWLVKLDNSGTVAWQKTYGGTNADNAFSLVQTSGGGYVIAGYTKSFGTGKCDVLVMMLDSSGAVTWEKTYGGTNDDIAYSMAQTSDGGYIVAGCTKSFGAGGYDAWILKLDGSGITNWQKTCGGTSDDIFKSVVQTSDGGYVAAGYTKSFGAGLNDYWVVKLDSSGAVVWEKTYGGATNDYCSSMSQTSDGGYVAAGYSYSFGAGDVDAWILKLDGSGAVVWEKNYAGTNNDLIMSMIKTSDGGYAIAGYTKSFGGGMDDSWVLKLDGDGNLPGAGFMYTTSASVSNSAAAVGNTFAAMSNSAVTVGNTSVSGVNSSAIINVQHP